MASNNNQYATPPAGFSQGAVSNSVMMAMMRNNMSGGGPNSNTVSMGGGTGNNGGGHLLNQLQARLGQILDDADHRRCSEGNQRALLAEKLENLRQLTKELEKDEWMYTSKKTQNKSHLSLKPSAKRSSQPF